MRLIDSDKLTLRLLHTTPNPAPSDMFQLIDSCETVNQFNVCETVPHGHWKNYIVGLFFECSVCGHTIYGDITEDTNFCERCGAKMDEEVSG